MEFLDIGGFKIPLPVSLHDQAVSRKLELLKCFKP